MSMKQATGHVAELADELQDAAEELFVGDTRFTDITIWDDGDYHIIIQHTFDVPDSGVGERHREVIVYHDSKHNEPLYRIEYNWCELVDADADEYTWQTDVLQEMSI